MINHKFMGTMFADKPVSGQEATWVGELPCAGKKNKVVAPKCNRKGDHIITIDSRSRRLSMLSWGNVGVSKNCLTQCQHVTVSKNPVAGEVSMFHNIIIV